MSSDTSRFLAGLWRAVVRIDTRQTILEYREDAEIVALCASVRSSLRTGMDKLVDAGQLLRDFEQCYWFEAGCKVPVGCQAPTWALASKGGPGVARLREHVAHAMPIDDTPDPFIKLRQGRRFDFMRFPSRCGNRLYHPDGRITDLDNNPIETSA